MARAMPPLTERHKPLSGPAPRTRRPSCISGASQLDCPAVTLQTASCGWMEQRGWRRLSMEGRTMDTRPSVLTRRCSQRERWSALPWVQWRPCQVACRRPSTL